MRFTASLPPAAARPEVPKRRWTFVIQREPDRFQYDDAWPIQPSAVASSVFH
jgi:hypothetical protein